MITVIVDNGVYEEGIEIPDNIHPVALDKLVNDMIPDNIPCIVLIEDSEDGSMVVYDNIKEGAN
jgi:hypothetical protein